jgi:hypothetical protein
LAFRSNGNLLVASRGTRSILEYESESGAHLGTFAADPQLGEPGKILFGPDGDLYAASRTTNQVLRFDGQSGALIGSAATGTNSDPIAIVFAEPTLLPEPDLVLQLVVGLLGLGVMGRHGPRFNLRTFRA